MPKRGEVRDLEVGYNRIDYSGKKALGWAGFGRAPQVFHRHRGDLLTFIIDSASVTPVVYDTTYQHPAIASERTKRLLEAQGKLLRERTKALIESQLPPHATREEKLETLFALYRKGEISLQDARRFSGLSTHELFEWNRRLQEARRNRRT